MMTDTGSNQVKLYNTDHTLWKSIPVSIYPGYKLQNVFAVSDNLFNSDNLIELGVSYYNATTYVYRGEIINESGAVIKDLANAYVGNVRKVGEEFKLVVFTVGTGYTYDVYSLPGTIPCNSCATLGLGRGMSNSGSGMLSSPIPNPNSGEVTIQFTLPEGVSMGTITIVNANGQQMRSITVQANQHSIYINTEKFPSGIYQYFLTGEGIEPSSNKMVIVR